MSNYKYWIALEQTKGIGPVTLKEIHKALIEKNLCITDLFELNKSEISGEFRLNSNIADSISGAKTMLSRTEDEYCQLMEAGAEAIFFFDSSYPVQLLDKMENSFPPVVYVFGNKKISRNSAALFTEAGTSSRGKNIALLAIKELCEHSITIISSLDKNPGILIQAAALEYTGTSVSVASAGLLRLKMPAGLENIFIPEKTTVISPFYPLKETSVFNEYAANRIACALSKAVYIIECRKESVKAEAARSGYKLNIPVYTTEYADYPESASGNQELLKEFAGAVKGRIKNNELVPNLDKLIGDIRFSNTQKRI